MLARKKLQSPTIVSQGQQGILCMAWSWREERQDACIKSVLGCPQLSLGAGIRPSFSTFDLWGSHLCFWPPTLWALAMGLSSF